MCLLTVRCGQADSKGLWLGEGRKVGVNSSVSVCLFAGPLEPTVVLAGVSKGLWKCFA